MVNIGSLTIGEIFGLSAKVLEEYDVFTLGKKATSKIFLQKLLKLDESTSFKEVEQKYRESKDKDDTPIEEEKFWDFIAKKYLNLENEPREEFLELSFQVSADLSKIADNLAYIAGERKVLAEKKHLSADERYYRNQLDYFKDKNLIARDEIIDFMTKGIRSYAIKEAASRSKVAEPILSLFKMSPYAFGRRLNNPLGDSYDVRSLDEFSNKFMDLPISSYRELIKKCKESPDSYKELALAYINGVPGQLPSMKEKLEKLVATSHLLDRRKQVINTMLGRFETKDYISFVSMAPLQIEGIFADICREIGVSESELDISSLNDKLQHIDGKMNSFFFFEYYSFKFPVLRNLVAHGGLMDGELENTAINLMLDLLPVCELAVSEELPINHAIKVLEQASKKNFGKLIEWLDLRDKVSIPDFYGMQETIASAEALYSSQEFWDYLVEQLKWLNNEDEVKGCIPVKVAGKLKSKGFAKEQCENFFRNAKNVAGKSIQTRKETLEKFRRVSSLKEEKEAS